MATKKATAKKPVARKSRKVTSTTKRSAKPASRRAARRTPQQQSWSFTRMLADMFGFSHTH
ncbi:MAG: hypothetical protein ACAH80_03375 [Alphaproteobacteria bacterium]